MNLFSKTMLSTALLAVSSASLAASNIYVGFGVSTGSGDEEYSSSGYPASTYDVDQSQTQFILGFHTGTDRRFEISANSVSVDFDDGFESEEYTGFDLDWYYTFESQNIKPFFGFGFGFYTYEDTAYLTYENEDISGISLNLAGGVLLPLHENFELELAYRYKNISWQDVDYGFVTVESASTLSSIAFTGRLMF